MKAYTISNYPYMELRVIHLKNGGLEISNIEYDKKGKITEKGFILISRNTFNQIKLFDALEVKEE